MSSVKTTEEQLIEVQAAITKCLQRQRYAIGDREVWSAELEQLQEREEFLLKRYSREQALKHRGTRSVRFI